MFRTELLLLLSVVKTVEICCCFTSYLDTNLCCLEQSSGRCMMVEYSSVQGYKYPGNILES